MGLTGPIFWEEDTCSKKKEAASEKESVVNR